MEFNKLVKERASIRRYSSKKIRTEEIVKLIETSNLAPSPGNLQILRYVIIENPETIEKISVCCQQRFISQAPVIVVVCSHSENTETAYDKRAKKYIKQHAGAAIENFLLKATNMGLVSCWVGAFSEHSLRRLLRIPDTIEIEAVLPVGYRLITDKTKQRRKPVLQDRVFFEIYSNKYQKPFRSAYPA